MTINIDDIIIKERFRKDQGDIEALAEDIRENGLLQLPVVNKENRLLAGERRIRACKELGWTEIDVCVMDTRDADHELSIELSENLTRKSFTREEAIDAGRRLERIVRAKAEERMKSGKANPEANNPKGKKTRAPQTRDIVAKKLGMSGKQYEREKDILENRDLLSDEEFDEWNLREVSTNKTYNLVTDRRNAENEKEYDEEHVPSGSGKTEKSYNRKPVIDPVPTDNELLKAQINSLKTRVDSLMAENKKLMAENEKLRVAAHDMENLNDLIELIPSFSDFIESGIASADLINGLFEYLPEEEWSKVNMISRVEVETEDISGNKQAADILEFPYVMSKTAGDTVGFLQ